MGPGTIGSVDFDNEAKCREVYVDLACVNGGKAGFDYAGCTKLAEAASCVDAASGKALFPAQCNVNL